MKAIKILSLSLILTALTACNNPASPEDISSVAIIDPTDYGNGVFYFPAMKAQFGKSLAFFIEKNKNHWRVISVTGNGATSYGMTAGYFVIAEEM